MSHYHHQQQHSNSLGYWPRKCGELLIFKIKSLLFKQSRASAEKFPGGGATEKKQGQKMAPLRLPILYQYNHV